MLEFIRKHSGSFLIKIFLGLLAVTFVFCFGISDIIRRYTGKDFLVKIGNIKISPEMFNLEKNKKLNMLRRNNQKVDEKYESIAILHQIVWENIINLAASDFGFIIFDETIKKYIVGMSMFRDQENKFSPVMLRNFLYKIQVPEQMFVEFSKKDIKNALIKAPLRYVSVSNELQHYIKAKTEKRSLSIVELDPNKISFSTKPKENELENFHSENQDLFIVDETRDFTILEMYEKDIAKNIKISEEDIKSSYEMGLEKDSRTYAEMKNEIESELKHEKLQEELNDITRQIEDALIGGEDIAQIIEKFNIKKIEVKNVNILNKKDKTSGDVLKCNYKKDALTVAFSIEEGSDSSFAEAVDEKGNRLLWLVHVDSITPKHVANFEKSSNEVMKEWTKAKKKEKAFGLAKTMIEQSSSDKKLSSVASKQGYKTKTTPMFDRFGKGDDKSDKNNSFSNIISGLYGEAFAHSKQDVFMKEIDGKVVVAQINSIVPGKKLEQKERTQHHVDLIREMSEDLYQQLVGYLSKKKYDVKINYEMLKDSGENIDSSQVEDMF